MRWGFTEGGLDRIVSIYEPENVASGKVMEHLGFTPYLTTTHPERGEAHRRDRAHPGRTGRRAKPMGDLAQQTEVTPVPAETDDADAAESRRFTAMVHDDWEIWGPEGGYVAAIALRAAGAASPFARPASFFCHYLSVADFAPVDLVVTPLRSGRTVHSQRVEMSQEGRPSRRHGVVGRATSKAWSITTSARPMSPIPRSCPRPRSCGPIRSPGSPSGTTSTSGPSTTSKRGRLPDRPRRRGGPGSAAGRGRPSTIPGSMPPAP